MKRITIVISADLPETGDALADMAAHGKVAEKMRQWIGSPSSDELGITVSQPEIVDVRDVMLAMPCI